MFEKGTTNLKKEPCRLVWFLFLLKKTPTECYLMTFEAYRDQVINRTQAFHWHKQFREGRTLSVAVKQSGRPVSISTVVMIKTIRTLITDDSSLTQRKITAHLMTINFVELKICCNCLIVVQNPVGINFSAFVQMAHTGMPFSQLT